MSYDNTLNGLLANCISMSTSNLKAQNVVTEIQARNACMLPKEMKPSKKHFESIGFVFEDIDDDDILCQATLPDGWTLEPDGEYLTHLVDEKGRNRGIYFYKSNFNRYGEMNLSRRFHIVDFEGELDDPFKVVVKDADGSTIFNAGQCKNPYGKEYNNLINIATEYLAVNYPEWEDPTKYWD